MECDLYVNMLWMQLNYLYYAQLKYKQYSRWQEKGYWMKIYDPFVLCGSGIYIRCKYNYCYEMEIE